MRKIYNFLKEINWLRVAHQKYWTFKYEIVCYFHHLHIDKNYKIVYKRLCSDFGRRKMRVLFVIGDAAKWKCQMVYEKMMASEDFDPYVAPTIMDKDMIKEEFQRERLTRLRDFLSSRNVRMVDAASVSDLSTIPLSCFNPDIVVYQQPWGIFKNQSPAEVSRYALTFYSPYYLPAIGNAWSQAMSYFHRDLFVNFLEDPEWVGYFDGMSNQGFNHPRLMACGCPVREELSLSMRQYKDEGYVIYAPHWSFPHGEMKKTEVFSTILDTGRPILDFAIQHPEIKWVFKPHPVLKEMLIQTGVWSRTEVDGFYRKWEEIGIVCEDSNYARLFAQSRAMITDSLSFLSEYLIMNRPLIRLEHYDEDPRIILPPTKTKFQAMYHVRTEEELKDVLKNVILQKNDPMKEQRERIIRKVGYDDNDISDQMIKIFTELLAKNGKKH